QLALVDDMLHYFDRTSMAYSLEVRVPFLDHEVVEYCATIPTNLKVHGLTSKYVLKRAARGLIPPDIVGKRKLGFFRGASAHWLEAEMDGLVADYLLAPDARCAEFIDRSELQRLARRHANGAEGAHTHLLLSLLMLEVWLRSYVDRAAAVATRVPAP